MLLKHMYPGAPKKRGWFWGKLNFESLRLEMSQLNLRTRPSETVSHRTLDLVLLDLDHQEHFPQSLCRPYGKAVTFPWYVTQALPFMDYTPLIGVSQVLSQNFLFPQVQSMLYNFIRFHVCHHHQWGLMLSILSTLTTTTDVCLIWPVLQYLYYRRMGRIGTAGANWDSDMGQSKNHIKSINI